MEHLCGLLLDIETLPQMLVYNTRMMVIIGMMQVRQLVIMETQ